VRGQHFFFATKADLLPGLEYVESRWKLECHLYEMRFDRAFTFFQFLRDVPTLGRSDTGSTSRDPDYFVYPQDRRPAVRSIPQRRGGTCYVLDPSPETVHFRSGGLHIESGAFIAGRVARSVEANSRGESLYKELSQALLRGFNKIQAFWLGPEAFSEFRAGRRMVTMGIRSPREYDLAEM
jgi:hypothetical protein